MVAPACRDGASSGRHGGVPPRQVEPSKAATVGPSRVDALMRVVPHGHVQQLDKAGAGLLGGLAAQVPARAAGVAAPILARADSAYCGHAVGATAVAYQVCLSVTAFTGRRKAQHVPCRGWWCAGCAASSTRTPAPPETGPRRARPGELTRPDDTGACRTVSEA